MSTSMDQSSPATRVATPVQKEVPKTTEKVPDSPLNVVAELPPEDNPLANASTARKLTLMALFSAAQFLDAFNNSALFPAIPDISERLSFAPSETVWLISAYQLTFAAFLLLSGRISDVYNPKPAFVSGAMILALTHLGGGFVRQKIALLVLRALGGIGGALTIPSALSMTVALFPDQRSQGRAIAIFGGTGGVGNVLGLIIGALFVQYTSWPWIFYFTAIMGSTIGITCFILIPKSTKPVSKARFDVFGIATLSSAVILFIFAVTSGSIQGWATAYVLTPLIISVLLVVAFFCWEAYIDEKDAAIPPSLWRHPNVPVLTATALLPYFWWVTVFIQATAWFEGWFGWSAVDTAVRFLPIGVFAFIATNITGFLPRYFDHKYIILFGGALLITASAMLPFTDSPDTYWRLSFPAFIIGTIGCTIVFSNSNIAIFASTPPSAAGTVGAIFNSALQLGSAVGIAAVTSIQTSIDGEVNPASAPLPTTDAGWKNAYRGRAAGYWFVFAAVVLATLAVLVFFRYHAIPSDEEREEARERERDEKAFDASREQATPI